MRYIYHVTHIDNLPQIVSTGGLVSDSRKQALTATPTSIAYEDIKEKRARKVVPCGPQGCVADYVPFYFAPRSPMLYTISKGSVPERREEDIVYLVSTIERACDEGLGYVFTDGHPIMAFTSFYADLNDLQKVDWRLMDSKYWFDTDTDPDRKRRRQAEFLVRDFFPWNLVSAVAARNKDILDRVSKCIGSLTDQPKVGIKQEWYYD